MIDSLITWSMRHRLLVACATLLLTAFGFRAMLTLPIDAIPDLSENQVIVYADWPGRSPQEIEAQLTQPLSLSLQGLAGMKSVRGTSMFGFSLVQLIFEDGVQARSQVLERLNALRGKLPTEPLLGPDASGLGWVFQYYLAASGEHDLGELRTLQDTLLRPQLASVPGVAEIASVGGFVKQHQIEVAPAKMHALGVTLQMVLAAVEGSNMSVGGKTMEEN
ncbi:MAG: efflux RND transporter permease subunit, partial [Roseimicrobium sp.]